MTFNCLNCTPHPYPWGSAVVPRNPTGYYRTLWQAMDAAGCPRLYPAYAMACCPVNKRIQRGDHWDPVELDIVLTNLNNLVTPWGYSALVDTTGLSWYNAAVACALASPNPSAYGWLTAYSPATPNPWRGVYWQYGPPFTYWDLRTMTSWVYNAAAPFPGPVASHSILKANADAFGNPWLHAI